MVFDAALKDCEQALKIDPQFVKAHARSGFCLKGNFKNKREKFFTIVEYHHLDQY